MNISFTHSFQYLLCINRILKSSRMKCCTNFESHIRHKLIRCKPRIFEKINFISLIKFQSFPYFMWICILLNSFSVDFNLGSKSVSFHNFIKFLLSHLCFLFLFLKHYCFFLYFQKFYGLSLIDFIFILINLIKKLFFLLLLFYNPNLFFFQFVNLFLIFEIQSF